MITQRNLAASVSEAEILVARASIVSCGRGWRYLQSCGQRCWWFLETNSSLLMGLVSSKGNRSWKGLLLVVFRRNLGHIVMEMPSPIG